jgi:hypothetical protein
MSTSDLAGFVLYLSFGLWWLLFPNSVIRLCAWLLRGKAPSLKPLVVRLIGLAWIVLFCVVIFSINRQMLLSD